MSREPTIAVAAPAARPVRDGPRRVLLLFPREWDASGCAPMVQRGEIELVRAGFDLDRAPGNLRLLWFDARRQVDRLAARYRGRIDAVLSNDEPFGCLLAAMLAQRLGLPGADPAAVATIQHKLLLRRAAAAAAPDAAVAAAVLPFDLADPRLRDAGALERAVRDAGLRWPLFTKPVRATFSVLARQVRDAGELARHLTFSRLERHLMLRLVAPYQQLAEQCIGLPCPASRMLVEAPVAGLQVNVDGYVCAGDVRLLGVVDEEMYPGIVAGARHFARFSHPSRLPAAVQQRCFELVRRLVTALGLRHGFFNCELFVLPDGSLRLIEINPRLATQFAGIYRDVVGFDVHRALIALGQGLDPEPAARRPPRAGAGASIVFRCFDGRPGPRPARGARAWLAHAHPDAELTLYHKRGGALRREYRWLGSHRYGVLNVAAPDRAALATLSDRIANRLGWTPPACADPLPVSGRP